MLAANSCASSSCCMFASSSTLDRMLMPVDIAPHYDVVVSMSTCQMVRALTCEQAMFWEKADGLNATGVL